MPRFGKHLDYRPRDAPLAPDRLITVAIGADRERSDLVAPLGEFGAETLCRTGFGEQLASSEERRVGEECVTTCRSRRSPPPQTKPSQHGTRDTAALTFPHVHNNIT